MSRLTELARSMQDYVVGIRRELHLHPELRWQEERTLARIRTEVAANVVPASGINPNRLRLHEGEGGIWFDLDVNSSYDRLIFRADVDALPITEATGLPFSSDNPGVMHACGHDIHSAMLLGAMKAIISGDVTPTRNLRFVFQRAEENPGTDPRPESGGEVLVKHDGVLEGVSAAYGLHIWNNPEGEWGTPGVFFSRPEGLLGNSGRIKLVLEGGGGHVAKPHTGLNMKWVTAAIEYFMNTFIARHIDPNHPTTLNVVVENAGTASNVLAKEATVWIAFRTMRPRAEHMALMDLIEEEIQKILPLFPRARIKEIEKIGGHPATINTPAEYARISDLLAMAGQKVKEHPAVLGGEDFAWYLEGTGGVPGCFWFLGSFGPDSGNDHHWDNFSPDESVFWKGVLFWLLLATN